MQVTIASGAALMIVGALCILILVPGIPDTVNGLLRDRTFSVETWRRGTKATVFVIGLILFAVGLVTFLSPYISAVGLATSTLTSMTPIPTLPPLANPASTYTSTRPLTPTHLLATTSTETPTMSPAPIPGPVAGNLVEYFPFDTSAAGWEDMVTWDPEWENPQTIKDAATISPNQIEPGVAYTLTLSAGQWLHHTVQYAEPVQVDVIVAYLYLPETPDIKDNWVGIAAARIPGIDEQGSWLASSGGPIPLGEWTQMVLDLRDKYDPKDKPLNSRPISIQVAYLLQGSTTLSSGTVQGRLDDVAFYKNKTRTEVAVREQRGAGRILFDFEQEYPEGWEVSSRRVQSDTLTVSWENVYRGRVALKLDTHLTQGASNLAYVRHKWSELRPNRGLLAHIYLPANASPDVVMWANLFVETVPGWYDSEPVTLEREAWSTLLWDTRDVDWDESVAVGIQLGAEDGSYEGPIYIDDIQVFGN